MAATTRDRKARLAIAVAALLTGGAAAGQEAETIDTIVVTGSRVAELAGGLPSSTTVVDRAEIEARNPAGVLDLLRSIPGLNVTQPGGRGGVSQVFIRGGEPNFTMVLLDGIRVNDPNNTRGGSFDFSTLHLGDIERIEIVRGPQSAIYGSDALSGVINIITKDRAAVPAAAVHAELGEYGYRRGAISVSGPTTNSGGFVLHAATLDDGDITAGNSFTSDSLSGKLSFGADDSWDLKLFGHWSNSDGTSFPEDSGGPAFAVLDTVDRKSSENLSLGFAGSLPLPGNWTLHASASRYDHDDAFDSPGVAPGLREPVPPNSARSELDRSGLSVHAVGNASGGLRATLGFDAYDEEGRSQGSIEFAPGVGVPSGFALERTVTGVFGELRYRPGERFTFLASLRHDEPEEEAGETTTKLGMLYDLGGGRTTLRANWGEGFKLPSFFALGSPLVGNPGLEAERSESADVGVTRRFTDESGSVTLSVYRNEFTDLIDFDFDLFTNVNRSAVVAKGAELELARSLGAGLAIDAELSYVDLEVRDSDTPLRQRPEWRGSIAVRYEISRDWLLHSTWSYVGEAFDSSVPTGGVTLPAYDRLDATLSWRPAESVDLLLAVDNLPGADYEEAVGFPAPGRRARLALRYRF